MNPSHLLRGLAAALVLASGVASAQSFTVRLPLVTVAFAPQVQAYDFGTVAVGSRPSRAFQFINKSTSALTLTSTSAVGGAVMDANNCPATLAPGASCLVTVALPVAAEGAKTGEVRVLTNGSSTPEVLRVSAQGASGLSVLSVSPGSKAFGEVSVGSQSAAGTFTLSNTTAASLHLGALYLAENSAYFSLSSNCPTELEAGERCTVSVRFTPRLVGATQARIVRDLEDGTQVYVASVSGHGVRAEATWTMSQATFVDVPVGRKSDVQELGLTNTGRGVLSIQRLAIGGSSAFSLESHTCGTEVQPGASCIVRLAVTPPDATVLSASLMLESSSLESRSSVVQLYARPAVPQALLVVSPTALAFGDVPMGTTSATRSVTLTSAGSTSVAVSAFTLGGNNPGDFAIVNATQCTGLLAPNASCTLQLTARPGLVASRSATLTVTSTSAQAVAPVALTVRGVQGTLLASPVPVAFGEVLLGERPSRTVTLTNTGSAPVTLQAPSLSGANASLFTVSGCASQTLAPAASCTLTVQYAPLAAGLHSATLSLPSNASNSGYAVSLSGSGKAPPQGGTLSEFTCPDWSTYNQTVTCTATLTNTASSALSVSAATRTNTAFTLSHTCGTSVAVAGACTVSVSVPTGTWTSGTPTAKTLASDVTVTTGAGALTRTASVKVDTSQLSLSAQAYAPVEVGTSRTLTHVLTNNGKFPVTLNGAPSLAQVAPPGRLAVAATNCGTTLAVGQSCTVDVRCDATTASSAGTYSAQLAASGSNHASVQAGLACPVFVNVQASNFRISPNPTDFGSVPVGTTPLRTLTLENHNLAPIAVSSLGLTGAQAGDFRLSGSCTSLPARVGTVPGSCKVTVFFTPTSEGLRQATLEAVSSAQGIRASAALSGTGGLAVLSAPPVQFGSGASGGSAFLPLTITNQGPFGVTLPGATGWALSGANPGEFTLTPNGCEQKYLSTSSTSNRCTLSVTFRPRSEGTKSATLTVTSAVARPLVVPLSGSASPAPAPLASLGALSCATPVAVGGSTSCSATLTNRGTAPLVFPDVPLLGMNVDPVTASSSTLPTGVSRGVRCGGTLGTLAAGASCTYTFSLVVPNAGINTVHLRQVFSGVSPVAASAQVQGLQPALALTTQNHATTQAGDTSFATHRLTNTGSVPVTLTGTGTSMASMSGTTAISFAGTPSGGKACPATLAAGESCDLATRCLSVTPGTFNGTLTLATRLNGTAPSGAVSCAVQGPSFEIAAAGPLTTSAGGWSNSGNYLRVTNTGTGRISFFGAYAGDMNWTMVADSRNTSHCRAGAVVEPGASCLVLSMLSNGAPDGQYTALHRVRMIAGTLTLDKTFQDRIQTFGVSVVPTTPFRDVQVGTSQEAVFTVTNKASQALASIVPALSSTTGGFSLVSHTCSGGLAPAGQANSSCTVRVAVLPTLAGARTTQLRVTGAYPQVLNGSAQASVRSGVQGVFDISLTAVAPKLTVTTTAHSAVTVGQNSTATHTVRNDGVANVTLSSLYASPSVFTVQGGSCVSGYVLAPAASCTVTTRFAPTSTSAAVTTGTLTASATGVSGSAPLIGPRLMEGAVSVTVDDGRTYVMAGGSTTFSTTVKNPSAGYARVTLGTRLWASDGAALASQGALSCPRSLTGSDCTVSGTTATLRLAPYQSMALTQQATAGATAGALNASANITVSDVVDSTPADNAAENSTAVQYPRADIAVTLSPASNTVGLGASGEFQVTVTNLSSATNETAPSAAVTLDLTSSTAGLTVNLGGLSCQGVSGGAVCSAGPTLTLPPRGAVTLSLPYTVGNSAGTVTATVRAVMQSARVTDPNAGNNSARGTLNVSADAPVYKRCMFTSGRTLPSMGQWRGNVNGGSSPMSLIDNLNAVLFTGYETTSTSYTYLGKTYTIPHTKVPASGQVRWVGSNTPLSDLHVVQTTTLTSSNGLNRYKPYEWSTLLNRKAPVIPVAQVNINGVWTDSAYSWFCGTSYCRHPDVPRPSVILRNSTVKTKNERVGNSYVNTAWVEWEANANIFSSWESDTGTPGRFNMFHDTVMADQMTTYRSWPRGLRQETRHDTAATGAQTGLPVRQTWVEASPGQSCQHPEAIRLDYKQPQAYSGTAAANEHYVVNGFSKWRPKVGMFY